jgi:hypothetical protein
MEILTGRWLSAGLTAVLAALAWTPLDAQTVTAPMLKAAFVYSFVKFTEWPTNSLARGERLSLCVVGDGVLAEALEKTVEAGGVDGHQLSVEVITPDGPLRSCHLLYVSGLDGKRTGQLLAIVRNTASFTVSDTEHFAEMGGVAQLIQENNRLRFAVNIEAAERAHLKISSRLLSLAQIVKDQDGLRH